MAVWNKETPAIAPFVGRGIEDANIFTPKSFGPRITNKEGTDDQGLFTYNPITGMAGLSFVPDIPAMVIAPIFKTAFGYDPVTGDSARPTVGDWVSTALTFAGAAEARGTNVLGTAKNTVTNFLSSNTGRVPAGKSAVGAVDDVIKQAPKVADDAAAVTKESINKAFLNDLNKVQHTYESIGTKNYPSYITESGKKFSSMDDVVSFLSAKRDIALSSLDDMAKESTKINNYVNTAGKFVDDVVKEGTKYGDDFWANMKDVMTQAVKEGSPVPPTPKSNPLTAVYNMIPEKVRAPVLIGTGLAAGYLGLMGNVGFGGFIVLDDQMQFDEFPITNGLGTGNFVSAAAALSADQHKHNTWQRDTALLAELVTSPFWIIDRATGLETQKNLPVIGQVITTYQSYGQRGQRAAYDASRVGVWVGDFKTGRPATREEVVTWYDKNKNDKVLFPNPPTKDEFNKELKHSYYKAVALNPNYDQQVKNISTIPGTPLEEILGKDKQGGGGAGSPQKGQGLMTGLGVNQIARVLLANQSQTVSTPF